MKRFSEAKIRGDTGSVMLPFAARPAERLRSMTRRFCRRVEARILRPAVSCQRVVQLPPLMLLRSTLCLRPLPASCQRVGVAASG